MMSEAQVNGTQGIIEGILQKVEALVAQHYTDGVRKGFGNDDVVGYFCYLYADGILLLIRIVERGEEPESGTDGKEKAKYEKLLA